MTTRALFFSPQILHAKPLKFQNSHPSHLIPNSLKNKAKLQLSLSCTNNISDAELAADLSIEMTKVATPLVQRNEAMNKSREVLFGELCEYIGLKEEEVKKKWREMDEEEKIGLAKGFVTVWGSDFHPLSSRSVKEMVEEHLIEANNPSSLTSPPPPPHILPSLKRIMRFLP